MTVGYPLTKADLDNTLGREIGAVADALLVIHRRKVWLDDASHNTAFMTGTLAYTTPEDTLMRNAIGDLDNLYKLSHMTAGGLGVAAVCSVAALSDFFFSAKQLGGINWYGSL